MIEDAPRLPRSYLESTAWTPDWRNRQAAAYLSVFEDRLKSISDQGRGNAVASVFISQVRFPAWEDDPLVKERFRHMAGAARPNSAWTQAFDWLVKCDGIDPAPQSTTALKAWLLAGLTDDEIANRYPIRPFAVMVFHEVFFDVRGYLSSPEVLRRVLLNGSLPPDASEWEWTQRTVFNAALTYGVESVDRLLIPCDRVSAAELNWLVTQRKQIQAVSRRASRAKAKSGNGASLTTP